MHEEEIKKLLTSKKLLLGKDEVLKNIRKGLVARVFIASNCPKETLDDLTNYGKMSGYELFETKLPNDELGTVCKKPFSVSVIGVLK